jgi:hypothetical protein
MAVFVQNLDFLGRMAFLGKATADRLADSLTERSINLLVECADKLDELL